MEVFEEPLLVQLAVVLTSTVFEVSLSASTPERSHTTTTSDLRRCFVEGPKVSDDGDVGLRVLGCRVDI